MRTFIATIAGLVAAVIAIKFFEYIGHIVYPVHIHINSDNLREIFLHVPPLALILVIAAHGLGLLAGLFVSRLIERSTKMPLYFISGLVIMLSVLNVLVLPHPQWFIITDMVVLIVLGVLFIQSRRKI